MNSILTIFEFGPARIRRISMNLLTLTQAIHKPTDVSLLCRYKHEVLTSAANVQFKSVLIIFRKPNKREGKEWQNVLHLVGDIHTCEDRSKMRLKE
jgi:hypothetical protein